MSARLRLEFAPEVGEAERRALGAVLAKGLGELARLGGEGRTAKDLYLVDGPAGKVLVKARRFKRWWRRLGRTLAGTKEKREFENALALAEAGVPTPRMLAHGGYVRWGLTETSVVVQEYLADAKPMSAMLSVAAGAEREALLDEFVGFLRLLMERRVWHQDLHWDNVLVRPAGAAEGRADGRRYEFYLIDALHVRVRPPEFERRFAESAAWFAAFLMARGAPAAVQEGFLARVPRLGLEGAAGRAPLPAEARALADRLIENRTYKEFRRRYATAGEARSYQEKRFTRSRRWRWIDRREQEIVGEYLRGLPAGGWVLDVPCGAGRLAEVVEGAGLRYAGADVSAAMAGLAREALGARGRPANVMVADALRLPLAEGSVDVVVSVRLFHRIREQGARVGMLREMARVSRGPVVATYYLRETARGLVRRMGGKYAGVSVGEIAEDARQAGLEVAKVVPVRRWVEQQCVVVLERRREGGCGAGR